MKSPREWLQPENRLMMRLAARDFRHEWLMSSCFVLALTAALVPLLVLFGLKYGIINNLLDPIRQDPRYREIVPSGSGHFTAEWFATMSQRDDVEFLLPKTRSIAATLKLRRPDSDVGRIIDVELIPSASGDPVLSVDSTAPTGLSQAVLSAAAADKLGAQAGDELQGVLSRLVNDQQEAVRLPLNVLAVAPASAFGRDGLFVSTELLTAIEDFRDGRAVPEIGADQGSADPAGERRYAGFRMYARDIDDVEPLRQELARQLIDVRTQAADIELVNKLDRNLSIVYWIIAVIVVVGFCVSFGTSLWANVIRKAREYSLLRLIGFQPQGIAWFPLTQALLTGALGWLLAVILFFLIQLGLNGLFLDNLGAGQQVCRLHPLHLLLALLFTELAAVLAASAGGWRVSRLELASGLRER